MSAKSNRPVTDLTAFQRDLLRVVAALDGAMGLDVRTEIQNRYSSSVYHSRVYQNMDSLVSMGLVSKDDLDGRTKAYRVTDRGRAMLTQTRDWTTSALEGAED